MTIPRLGELSQYWAQHPPVNELLGAFIGYKGSNRAAPQGSMDDLLREFGVDPSKDDLSNVTIKVAP